MARRNGRGQVTRLEDLEVKEVSVVDRPANKRKFLMIKNEDGTMAGKKVEIDADGNLTTNDGGDGSEAITVESLDDGFSKLAKMLTGVEKRLSIPLDMRTDLFRSMGEAMNRMHSVMGAADSATVDRGEGGSTLTPVLASELAEISKLLSGFAKRLGGVTKNDAGADGDDQGSDPEPVDKATWTTAQVNEFPDSSFMHIIPGGKKDDSGKTVPRSNRMFPIRDAAGKIDLPHLRNAIARIPQSNLSSEMKTKLQDQARKLLEQATKEAKGKGKGKDAAQKDVEGMLETLIEKVEKRGAKMSKKRLARFQDAIKTLSQILSELDTSMENSEVTKRLDGLADQAVSLREENAKLKAALRKAAARVPPSNVSPVEGGPEGGAGGSSDPDDTVWEMDMNSRDSEGNFSDSLDN